MQINNWSELVANKRLSKTVKNQDNDLIILGTYAPGGLKRQDPWQAYTMTVADLAAAIGGGGGGVSFSILGSNYTEIYQNGQLKTSAFQPAQGSTITFSTVSIPNGLNWKGAFSSSVTTYEYNDVVSWVDPDTDIYYTFWMKNSSASPPAGDTLPVPPDTSNTYWAQLGLQGPAGDDGSTIHQGTTAPANGTGITGDYYFNTTTKTLYGPKLSDLTWTGATQTILSGDNGNDGLNNATVYLYAKNNTPGTPPNLPTGGSTIYTFANGNITGQPLGWSATVPSSGDVLWVILQTASADTATATLSNASWTTPRILSQKGSQGDAATINVGTVTALSPGATPTIINAGSSSAAVFNFGIPGGAAATIAAGSASSLPNGSTPTVNNVGTANAAIFDFGIPDGQAGYRTAVLTLYKWVNSSTAPATSLPTGTATYTWASGTWATGGLTLNGWSTTIPAPTKGWHLYKIDTVLTNNLTTTTSNVSISGSPVVQYVSYAGADGGAIMTIASAQTGSYTVLTTDGSKLIPFDTAGATVEITVPDLTGMQNGSQIIFVWNSGSVGGVLKFKTSGTTILSPNSMLYFRAIGSSATLIKLTDTSFYITGDLAPY